LTVRTAVRTTPPWSAVIVTKVVAWTTEVVIVKSGDVVDPAGIVTLAGTIAAVGSELLSVTTVPPDGAGAPKPTLFWVVEVPPVTDVGLRERVASPDG